MKKSHNSKDIAHLGHPSTSSSPNIAGMSIHLSNYSFHYSLKK